MTTPKPPATSHKFNCQVCGDEFKPDYLHGVGRCDGCRLRCERVRKVTVKS